MLRVILCLFSAACCAGAGYAAGRRYLLRVRQLEKCDQLLLLWQNLLTAECLTTGELVARAAEGESLSELAFLPLTAKRLEEEPDFPRVWLQSLEDCRGELALSEEDYPPLRSLSEIIGALDAASQAQALGLSRELLRQNLSAAREQSRVNGKLCRSLGALSGIAVAILLL